MTSSDSEGGLDVKRWNTLYPNYINSKKTVQEGRRIGAAKAAERSPVPPVLLAALGEGEDGELESEEPSCVEHPHAAEMAKVCEFLKIPHVLEMDKAYPRDWLNRGRVKVLLKTEDGKFTHPEIHTKTALMCKMGELIPQLENRKRIQQQAAASGGAAAAASSGAAPTRDQKKEAKKEEKKA
ncbi:unnamed protein product, partial [Prorocentrum cordatum]